MTGVDKILNFTIENICLDQDLVLKIFPVNQQG